MAEKSIDDVVTLHKVHFKEPIEEACDKEGRPYIGMLCSYNGYDFIIPLRTNEDVPPQTISRRNKRGEIFKLPSSNKPKATLDYTKVLWKNDPRIDVTPCSSRYLKNEQIEVLLNDKKRKQIGNKFSKHVRYALNNPGKSPIPSTIELHYSDMLH